METPDKTDTPSTNPEPRTAYLEEKAFKLSLIHI